MTKKIRRYKKLLARVLQGSRTVESQEVPAVAKQSYEAWAMSPERFVNSLYHVLLGRAPDEPGFLAHVADLKSTGDPTNTFQGFLGSPECRAHLNLLLGGNDWINEIAREDISSDFGFNEMLHQLRTDELKRSEGTDGTMVSVGCSNRSYFDWIHSTLGEPQKHIGLEYYSPKPDDLPPNVIWIANTAGNMSDVATDSVDLIFGGQVVEHLWADELASFLHECCRVLKPGGRLMFDTPNELVTTRVGWKHAEHTTEFRPEDARVLLETLGFSIEKLVGHWLVVGDDGWLRLNRITDDEPYSRQQRMALGLDRPERSFSWWIEARYDGTTTPDKELTRQIVRDMWMRYGHYQLNRTTRTDADLISSREEGLNGRFVRASRGFSGYLLQSTSNALPPGRIIVGVELDPYEFSQSPGYLEIAHRPSNRVLAKKPLPARFEGGRFFVEGDVPETLFSADFNLYVSPDGPIATRMAFIVSASVWNGELWNLSELVLPAHAV